ncbi:LAME_0D09648g1_1 [Lachancea meyersii CBS 8951]|uniref:LAME_0D09648g1_1 n=1 Tax=Lachancea meyersii CBS 8951 TaxID=1266667 RepID=A0A1G4JBA5_9SACH|nr:LAME_0D09648g1_1 [Lachancea meyersii CBS 8951]
MAREPVNHSSKSAGDHPPTTKKRRRKTIKSCTFCRQRKLKCDQQKPMCGACAARKLPECVYTDGFNFQLTSDELFSKQPNVTLLRRIRELEEALDRATLEDDTVAETEGANCSSGNSGNSGDSGNSGKSGNSSYSAHSGNSAPTSHSGNSAPSAPSAPSGHSGHSSNCGTLGDTGSSSNTSNWCPDGHSDIPASVLNPGEVLGKKDLTDFYVLREKDGRHIYYGPTSIRAVITASGDRFVAEYVKVWRKVKSELDAWKNVHGGLITMDYSSLEYAGSGSLINSILPDLPPYETIESRLLEFFDDPLHTYYQFLDKDKVLRDFSRCFVPGYIAAKGNDNVPRRQVAMVLTEDKKMFFIIGIVLMILSLLHYKKNIPTSFQRLSISLLGFTTAKSLYVERAQFLLLVYMVRVYNGLSGSGCSHLVSLSTLLCSTSMSLGLHKDIDQLYAHQSAEVGSLTSLKNLWYWTLFVDLNVSFDIGSPMAISSAHYDDSRLVTFDRGRIALLRNFLFVGRKCMHAIFDTVHRPPMMTLVSQLTDFIEGSFKPLKYYTDSSLISEVDLFDIMILSPTMAMITNFYDLTRVSEETITISIKNGFFKSMLIGTAISVNTILRCYALDEERLPSSHLQQSNILTPSLNLCVLLLGSLPTRMLTELYGLLFYKITLFEKGLIVSMDEGIVDGPSLDDLSVPDGLFLSFRGSFTKFCSIFDELWKPEHAKMTRMLWNSHYYVIMMALERVNRTVFQVGLDSRTRVEVTHNWPSVGNEEVPDDVVKMLADEVWNSYSNGFTDLIEMDAGDFITDFDMLTEE